MFLTYFSLDGKVGKRSRLNPTFLGTRKVAKEIWAAKKFLKNALHSAAGNELATLKQHPTAASFHAFFLTEFL
jgi:hypothetical protein